jgi:hypothetical protein
METIKRLFPKTHLEFYFKPEFGRICGVKRRKPGFPLQFLAPLRGLRDFRCNPLRKDYPETGVKR